MEMDWSCTVGNAIHELMGKIKNKHKPLVIKKQVDSKWWLVYKSLAVVTENVHKHTHCRPIGRLRMHSSIQICIWMNTHLTVHSGDYGDLLEFPNLFTAASRVLMLCASLNAMFSLWPPFCELLEHIEDKQRDTPGDCDPGNIFTYAQRPCVFNFAVRIEAPPPPFFCLLVFESWLLSWFSSRCLFNNLSFLRPHPSVWLSFTQWFLPHCEAGSRFSAVILPLLSFCFVSPQSRGVCVFEYQRTYKHRITFRKWVFISPKTLPKYKTMKNMHNWVETLPLKEVNQL